MQVSSSFLEALFISVKDNNYNGVCCINFPIVAVFLDQKMFPYLLFSGSYEFDFLDHFMELDLTRQLEPNRGFDLLLCDATELEMPVRTLHSFLGNNFKSSREKIVYVNKGVANRFIQSGLFRPASGNIASLTSKNAIALAI